MTGNDIPFRLPTDDFAAVLPCAESRVHDGDTVTLTPGAAEEGARFHPEQSGDFIGRYRLLEEIGEGGFGVVWMAEQMEPVTRRVALKIIKAGMDTRDVIARFEVERQTLAMMDHPSIARVFDAGATQSGRPFFVMEMVPGVRITDYCDRQELDLAARIRLFIAVCHAVQHAHQKGVIHRDLKPSNILVTAGDDDQPLPKVIDFGVAKATQGRSSDQEPRTHSEQMIGTPLYMSPEQAEMDSQDIDTRSDIYSLGVLLYELLTGSTPIGQKTLRRQGFDEIRRIICGVDAPLPSLRVKTLGGDTRTVVAAQRRVPPDKLPQMLHGDLDGIVMKALEKDRTQRYETASAFAADLRRFLANEPVSAAAPSRVYRFRKFVRRHRTGFGVSVAIAAMFITATFVSVWQAVRAMEAERVARERVIEKDSALKEAESAFKFLTDLFQSADPDRNGRAVTFAETLDRAAQKLETDPAIPPLQKAKMQGAIGWTYQSLGLYPEAIPLLEKSRDFFLATAGEDHRETLIAMHNLAWTLFRHGRIDEALQMRDNILPRLREAAGPDFPGLLTVMELFISPSFTSEAERKTADTLQDSLLKCARSGVENQNTLFAMAQLAGYYQETGHLDESIRIWEHVVSLSGKLNGETHSHTLWAMQGMAAAMASNGRRDDSIRMEEKVLSGRREFFGVDHPDTLIAMDNLADSFAAAGRREEAVKLDEEALKLCREKLGGDSALALKIMSNLADFHADLGRLRQARELREKVLAAWKAKLWQDEHQTLEAMTALARTLTLLKEYDGAEALLKEVLTKTEKSGTQKELGSRLKAMAELRLCRKQFAEAEVLCRRRIETRRSRSGWEKSFTLFDARAELGRLLAEWAWEERETAGPAAHERALEAADILREALAADLRDKTTGAQHRPNVLSRLGGALCAAALTDPLLNVSSRQDRLDEAEKILLDAQAGMEKETVTRPPALRDGLVRLVRLYEAANRPKPAAVWRERLENFDKAAAEPEMLTSSP